VKSFKRSSNVGDGGGDGVGGFGSRGGRIPCFRSASLLNNFCWKTESVYRVFKAYNSVSSFGLTAMSGQVRTDYG